jgi:hypothetical protein
MMLEILAAFVAGVAAAGIAMALRAMTRGRLPRWIVPAAAGAGMIGFTIWSEYAWQDRAVAGLPPGFVVAEAIPERSPLRPWTYAVPLVTRMLVVDLNVTLRHPVATDLALTRVVGLARWEPNREWRVVLDCAQNLRVNVTEGIVVSDAGVLTGGAWSAVAPDDAVLRTACDGG